jgi:hypothetical protein
VAELDRAFLAAERPRLNVSMPVLDQDDPDVIAHARIVSPEEPVTTDPQGGR